MLAAYGAAQTAVDVAVEAFQEDATLRRLASMPLERLRPLATERVAWSALSNGGIRTVADVYRSTPWRLEAIRGVGEQSAHEVTRLARSVHAETKSGLRLQINADDTAPETAALVDALVRLDDVNQRTRASLSAARAAEGLLGELIDQAQPAGSAWRWLFTSSRHKAQASDAAARLASVLADPTLEPLSHPSTTHGGAAIDAQQSRRAFLAEPARYLSLLDSRVGNVQSVHGDLDQSVVDRIDALELDTSLLSVMLRRYQSFGARFAIAQERVILGDDMGLGKTVQALAVMCHLAVHARARGRVARFLVVAPASVLVNWERETAAKSDLAVFGLHGSRDPGNLAAWQRDGGVAITTFEYTAHLECLDEVDLLVVDEAHYVKNPEAQRTQRVAQLSGQARRVMLMTGTPIENRADEFIDLITMINVEIGAGLTRREIVIHPEEFRHKIAPIYLRRNAIDVLTELPDRIEVDEWEDMTDHDDQHYLQALESGNFMALRRAGFAASAMGASAKMNRLLEIVEEAADSGHKVIAYSYFHDVLNAVAHELGNRAFGPLTGAMPLTARQALVDDFAASPAGSVLISQVVAGGVGLNIQSASIIIMCEPQLKPSAENQAIARAHRMGQLKTVQVHRLLNPDSIDERIEEILRTKEGIFREYAHDSDLAEAAGDAIDARTILTIIQGERERRGVSGTPPDLTVLDGELP